MAKLPTAFTTLLSNIEPESKYKKYAQDAHEPVRDYLEQDDIFGEFMDSSFLYGSYRRSTAVDNIKDIDIALITRFDPNSEDHTPKKVLSMLKTALNKYYKEEYNENNNTEYQRKSILVKTPLPEDPEIEMTLDILPAIAPNGSEEILLVPDRELSTWVESHPKAHIWHTSDLNDESDGMFVPLVKMLKHWWKLNSKKGAKPKGFWLESLAGECLDKSKDNYAEHFVSLLQNIRNKYLIYKTYTTVPQIIDPGLSGEYIKTKMNVDEFKEFMDKLSDCLSVAVSALNEENESDSSELWRKVFGEAFPPIEAKIALDDRDKNLREIYFDDGTSLLIPEVGRVHAGLQLGTYPHLMKPKWPELLDSGLKVEIKAQAEDSKHRKKQIISDEDYVLSNLSLEFEAVTNVREPYMVEWQVVNTGKDVEGDPKKQRGGFETSKENSKLLKKETTQYTGKHWVECFVIKDGKIVARSGRFYVNIFNPRTFNVKEHFYKFYERGR